MTLHIILVPGMCSVGDVVFKDLAEQLKTTIPDAKVHIFNLPSVDAIATKANLEPNGLTADIDALRSTIAPLAANDPLILIGHSYGGVPCLYAAEGLWGKQCGAKKVGLLASALPLPGRSVNADREEWREKTGDPPDPMPEVEQHGKETFILPHGFHNFWMNDLPNDHEVRSSLRPTPLSTLMSPTPEADVKQWDLSYLATTDLDMAMAEPFQKHLADRARAAGAAVDYQTIKAAHFAQVSQTEAVARWIAALAPET